MTWRRVAWIYLVLVVLAGYFAIFERAPIDIDPANLPPPVEESLLGVEPTAIGALTFRRGTAEVHAVANGGRWQVLRPVRANVPSDLLAALVGTLTAGQASEVLATASGSDLGDFGLGDPTAEIEVAMRDGGATVRVLLGALNPTGTALYAKRADRDAIFLIGLNVRYYTDLVFAGAASG